MLANVHLKYGLEFFDYYPITPYVMSFISCFKDIIIINFFRNKWFLPWLFYIPYLKFNSKECWPKNSVVFTLAEIIFGGAFKV